MLNTEETQFGMLCLRKVINSLTSQVSSKCGPGKSRIKGSVGPKQTSLCSLVMPTIR